MKSSVIFFSFGKCDGLLNFSIKVSALFWKSDLNIKLSVMNAIFYVSFSEYFCRKTNTHFSRESLFLLRSRLSKCKKFAFILWFEVNKIRGQETYYFISMHRRTHSFHAFQELFSRKLYFEFETVVFLPLNFICRQNTWNTDCKHRTGVVFATKYKLHFQLQNCSCVTDFVEFQDTRTHRKWMACD